MEIGFFQLENLVVARAPFCFLDLREGLAAEIPPTVQALLSQAKSVRPMEVKDFLKREKISKDHPIVLLCADGVASEKIGNNLEGEGYLNIYVVARGVLGLLLES